MVLRQRIMSSWSFPGVVCQKPPSLPMGGSESAHIRVSIVPRTGPTFQRNPELATTSHNPHILVVRGRTGTSWQCRYHQNSQSQGKWRLRKQGYPRVQQGGACYLDWWVIGKGRRLVVENQIRGALGRFAESCRKFDHGLSNGVFQHQRH